MWKRVLSKLGADPTRCAGRHGHFATRAASIVRRSRGNASTAGGNGLLLGYRHSVLTESAIHGVLRLRVRLLHKLPAPKGT